MYQTLGKSCHLYVEYLFTARLHVCRLGHKRTGIDRTQHAEQMFLHAVGIKHTRLYASLRQGKRGVTTALGTQTLHIDGCNDKLWVEGEALRRSDTCSVFIY